MEKVLMVGVGDVGTHILEFLARDPRPIELVVGDIDEKRAARLVNNAVIGAAHHGLHPQFSFRKIDLNNIEHTSDLIKEMNPKVIINCTVMHTWHLIRQLPSESDIVSLLVPAVLVVGVARDQAIPRIPDKGEREVVLPDSSQLAVPIAQVVGGLPVDVLEVSIDLLH